MRDSNLPPGIEVYDVGCRRLYVKLGGGPFAIFEDELSPEELTAIAHDIRARRTPGPFGADPASLAFCELPVNSGE